MNCIIVDDDDASAKALAQLAKQIDYLTVVKTCTNSLDALAVLQKERIDLVFLDVEMPEMSGIEMLRTIDVRPQIILTTSQTKYASEAFDLNVVDYLVKPIALPRFVKAVSKAREINEASSSFNISKDFFFIKNNSVLMKILIKDVLLIEALGDYVKLHTKDQRFILHATLKSLESKLPNNKFVRVHRSYIIQIDSIKEIEDTTIFINDISVPIGAIYKEEFIKRLNLLY